MRVSGKTIRLVDRVSSYMLMEIYVISISIYR